MTGTSPVPDRVGFGALTASPLSDVVGRFPMYLGALVDFGCSIVGATLVPDFGSQIALRFLAALMGPAPLTLAGGSVSVMWNILEITFAFPMHAIPAFGGSMLST